MSGWMDGWWMKMEMLVRLNMYNKMSAILIHTYNNNNTF
jgi:hypothetical protein